MLKMTYTVALAVTAITLSAGASTAAIIKFDSPGPNVTSLNFSSGGVSGIVTPYSSTGDGSEITQSADGLGVETLFDESSLKDTSGNVDGFIGVEGLLFEFNTAVYMHEVDFGLVDSFSCGCIRLEDDWTVKVNGTTVADDSTEDPFDFIANGVTGPVMSFSVEANGLDDDWTVYSFKATPVPLPAAGWLLLGGLGGLVAMKRRKKADA
jgi:hypothetical protein